MYEIMVSGFDLNAAGIVSSCGRGDMGDAASFLRGDFGLDFGLDLGAGTELLLGDILGLADLERGDFWMTLSENERLTFRGESTFRLARGLERSSKMSMLPSAR